MFFNTRVANGDESSNINIIDIMVTVKRMIDVVINTFFAFLLLAISLDITIGRDSCVRFIKKTILGFISIYKPVASIPTSLVVVTFAIVATIFTITLMPISEMREWSKVLFFKFITLSY